MRENNTISSFSGEYRFLSNFYPCNLPAIYLTAESYFFTELHDVRFFDEEEIIFPTVEHFFQAMKSKKWEDWKFIYSLKTAKEAKQEGRKLELRKDWETVKLDIMDVGLCGKFSKKYNPDLLRKLLYTGDSLLIEGNYWHDNFWGDCTCEKCKGIKGENNLGKLLMEVREWRKGM